MPERKTAPGTSGKPGAKKAGASKTGAPNTGVLKPAAKKPKSIVNQKQTPWGLIITTVVIVVLAVGVIGYALVNHKKKSSSTTSAAGADVSNCTAMNGKNATSYLNELKCAADISGVTFTAEPNRNHVTGVVKYDATPPVGGNHSAVWAECTGTVYSEPIANENAVHMLEHGAVWITYNPDLSTADVATLAALVQGKDHMAMSPFPGLKSKVSIQSWGYQLFVDSVTDPRLPKFTDVLRYNPKTTPEYGATCSDPSFNAAQSTPGHPQEPAA